MNLLLDTHILLWLLSGGSRIPEHVLTILEDPQQTIYVSAASAWEIAIKVSLKKLAVPPGLDQWLPAEVVAAGFLELPIQLAHALRVERLPRFHRDPFDRLLIAQAQVDGLTIVTADGAFKQYGIPLLEC